MKLQDQVCTLEQAKKLYELGVRGESLFYHTESKFGIMPKSSIDLKNGYVKNAFTVAELGVMLPDSICTNSNIADAEIVIRNEVIEWKVGYDYDRPTNGGYGADIKMYYTARRGKTEAEARAAMLILLLEDEKTTVEEVNKRLAE